MGKRKHVFECAEGLNESSVIVPLASNALGAPATQATVRSGMKGWAFFRDVPYTAGIGDAFKAVRPSTGRVEQVFMVAWLGFGTEWDAYLWHDQIFEATPENESIFKEQQRLAFAKADQQSKAKKAVATPKKRKSIDKPKKSDLELVRAELNRELAARYDDDDDDDDNNNNDGDDDATAADDDATAPDDDVAYHAAAATAAGAKRKKKAAAPASSAASAATSGAAVARAARAVEDDLRRPIFDPVPDLPVAAQWAAHTPWVDNEPRLHGALDDSVITLAFPQELIELLLKNQSWVKDAGYPLPLPRSPTVVDILNDFVRDGNEADYLNRLHAAQAFVSVFDACFALLLLYKNERPQFDKLKSSERRGPSTVYGAEHLLRFISRAPEVLGVVRMMPEVTHNYQRMLNQLILFLKAKRRDYFLSL